jgi:hypothetical protein
MKNKLLILYFLFISVINFYSISLIQNLSEFILNGKVHYVVTKDFSVRPNSKKEDLLWMTEKTFNESGLLIEFKNNLLNNKTYEHYKLIYDASQRLSKKVFFNRNQEILKEHYFEYNGNEVSEKNSDDNKTVKKFIVKNNLILEELSYNQDDSLNYKKTYKYNEDGKLIEESTRFSNNDFTLVIQYFFKDKKISRKVSIDKKGEIEQVDNYSYKYDKLFEIICTGKYANNNCRYRLYYDAVNNNMIRQELYLSNVLDEYISQTIEYYK